MTNPKIITILINWNQEEDTTECLYSLRESNYKNNKVVVVDNGSIDGSIDVIKKKFPEATVIKNGKNLGFSGGNNVGIKYAMKERPDYIFLLNNDTIIDKDMLNKLVEAVGKDEGIGIASTSIYFYDRPEKMQSVGAKIDFTLLD